VLPLQTTIVVLHLTRNVESGYLSIACAAQCILLLFRCEGVSFLAILVFMNLAALNKPPPVCIAHLVNCRLQYFSRVFTATRFSFLEAGNRTPCHVGGIPNQALIA
jgi:hypothetical protein